MPRIRITDEYALVKRTGSDNWYLEWRERGEKVRRSTGTSDAVAARVEARRLILAGLSMVDEQPEQVLLVDVIERYKMQRGDALPSSDTVKRALALWRDFWGASSVAEATIGRQEDFIADLIARGYSRGYVRRVVSVGKAALNRAWKRGEVVQVPHVELPQGGESYPHRATMAQLAKLLNTPMPDHVFAYCVLRLCTACRGDAALGLHVSQIDYAAKLVRLNPPDRQQTKKYRADVPLTDALARFLARSKPEGHVVHWHGRPVRSIKTTWRKIIVRAGLPEWFAPKVLRHTVATELRRRGVPAWDVAGIMGHRRGTTEIYAKFDPNYLGAARKAIDAMMRELAAEVPRLRGVNAGSVVRKTKTAQGHKARAVTAIRGGGRYRDRTCDPYHVKVNEDHICQDVGAQAASNVVALNQCVSSAAGSARGQRRRGKA